MAVVVDSEVARTRAWTKATARRRTGPSESPGALEVEEDLEVPREVSVEGAEALWG